MTKKFYIILSYLNKHPFYKWEIIKADETEEEQEKSKRELKIKLTINRIKKTIKLEGKELSTSLIFNFNNLIHLEYNEKNKYVEFTLEQSPRLINRLYQINIS